MPSATHDLVRCPDSGSVALGEQPAEDPERHRQQEDIEDRLLQQAVEENRRRVKGEHHAGDEPHAGRKEPGAGQPEAHTRGRSQRHLDEAHQQEIASERRVDDAEEVRIERSLVEDLGADPVACGNPPGPFVVAPGVAEQHVEERRGLELPEVNRADGQRHQNDCRGLPAEPRARGFARVVRLPSVRPHRPGSQGPYASIDLRPAQVDPERAAGSASIPEGVDAARAECRSSARGDPGDGMVRPHGGPGAAGPIDLLPRRRPDSVRAMRQVSPPRRPRALQPAGLRRPRAPTRRRLRERLSRATCRRGRPRPAMWRWLARPRLTDRDIDIIQRWVEAGAPEGARADLPRAPAIAAGWQMGAPDLEVRLPPYTLSAGGADVFRIFVAAIPVDRLRFVRGFEFRPGGRASCTTPPSASTGHPRRGRGTKRTRLLATTACWRTRLRTRTVTSSAGRRASWRPFLPRGWRGGSSPAPIWSSSCTCSRAASPKPSSRR